MINENQQKRDRDWSMLNSQVVGGEVFPVADHEKIAILKDKITTLEAKCADLQKPPPKESWSVLERRYMDENDYLNIDEIRKLIVILQRERNCAQENFRVTNGAYVQHDKRIAELKEELKDADLILGLEWRESIKAVNGDAEAARTIRITKLAGDVAERDERITTLERENAELRGAVKAAKEALDVTKGRISEYLELGGLFNPELMDSAKVQQMIIKIRDDGKEALALIAAVKGSE